MADPLIQQPAELAGDVTVTIGTLPAGTNVIGKVGIDQTTPGSTNAVSATNWPTTVSTGTGAQGASSPRFTVAMDSVTLAGSAPGTAGTASPNVVTIQGIASMTKLLVTPDSVALPANQSVNVAQVNGITTLTGTGAQGTGSQRITVATDSATVAGSASLPTGANTIGAVTQASGPWTTNQTQINGSAVATAATGVAKVGVLGNAGATLDATLAAGTAPTNGLAVIGQYNSTQPTPTTGQTVAAQVDANGNLRALNRQQVLAGSDAFPNSALGFGSNSTTDAGNLLPASAIHVFNGTSWDRARTATIGNGVAATGILASSAYGEYLTNVNQLALTTGQYASMQFTPDGALRTAPQRPATGDILSGYQTFTSTTVATTVITVPQGRTWVGTISANCSCAEAAAGTAQPQARAVFTTAGTNVTPAAGSYFAVDARSGANAAAGLVGSGGSNFGSTPFTITAPAGNSVTLQVTTTLAGTASVVDASAIGNLQ